MDETEITNSEYRQFVNWVKDSIIKTRLAITADEQEKKPGTGGIGEFAFADADTTKMSVYDKYMYKNYYSVGTDDDMYSGRKLNQKVKLIKDTKKYKKDEILFLSPNEAFGLIDSGCAIVSKEITAVDYTAKTPRGKRK